MDFTYLLQVVGDEPVFETGLLLAGDVDPVDVRRQLQDAVISTRTQLQLLHGGLEQPLAGLVHPAELAHLGRPHIGIALQRHCMQPAAALLGGLHHSSETLPLALPSCLDSGAYDA